MKSISHSPNSDAKQIRQSLGYLCNPLRWISWVSGTKTLQLESLFTRLHASTADRDGYAVTFSTGREALHAILTAIGIQDDDEVIIQAFTCIVVPNAIVWRKAKPIYVDIDPTFNLDPDLLEKAITKRTKAIIVQHTFGYPANMPEIMKIADKHSIPVIEDCAHALGATINGKKVGTFGKASLFSFGRDKMISSTSGGLAYTESSEIAKSLRKIQSDSPQRSRRWIKQNLFHPIIISLGSKLTGTLKLGQFLILTAQKLRLINKVYRQSECQSTPPKVHTYQMPNALADLAVTQLASLDTNIAHRQLLANTYASSCREQGIEIQKPYGQPSYLRFSLLSRNRDEILEEARAHGYLLGNWYNAVIMPAPTDLSLVYYQAGSCPNAEKYALQCVNLPTSRKFSVEDATEISQLLR